MAHHQPLDEEFSSRVLDSVQRNFLLPLLSRVTRGNTHTDGALGEVARAPHQRSCRRGMEAAVVQDRVRRGCAGSGGRSLAKCGGAGRGVGGRGRGKHGNRRAERERKTEQERWWMRQGQEAWANPSSYTCGQRALFSVLICRHQPRNNSGHTKPL